MRRALAAHGHDFRGTFAEFGWTNVLRDYEEADFGYPVPPLEATYNFGPYLHSTGWQAPRLRHLSTRFYRFRPQAIGAQAKLQIGVDLPGHVTNPAATAIVYAKGAPKEIHPIGLDAQGNGHVTVKFGHTAVWKVDLVLSNGSLRFDCAPKDFPATVYSCGGFPKDDGRAYRFRARLGP